jgi:rhodanese-related sulfurtransferase
MLSWSTFGLDAQSGSVEGWAYGAMLKTLLSHTVPEISVPEAAAEANRFLFLDAREASEYRVSQIPGARPIGYDHFNLAALDDVSKDQPIVVYCSVGYRSEKVSEQLRQAGYQTVYNLYGGIFEWKNQGNSVVAPDGTPTERVHAYSRSWGVWLKKGKKVYR